MQTYPIPKKMRESMALEPYYGFCALKGLHGHVCGGGITWEHALTFKGRRLNEPWAIIPICDAAHDTNGFQDAHGMVKDLNRWIALNRASDSELRAISKAIDYIRERDRLNQKYGIYKPLIIN